MQNNQNDDLRALSEKYKKELMSYYGRYKPTVVRVPTEPTPEPEPEPIPEPAAEIEPEPEEPEIKMNYIPTRSTEITSMSSLDMRDAPAPLMEACTSEGFLRVQVSTANGALPIQGAIVRVYKAENGQSVYDHEAVTDESGNTETLTLRTPSADLSQAPNPASLPYAEYQISVRADKFLTVTVEKVPIFCGVLSIQPIEMMPGNGIEIEEG